MALARPFRHFGAQFPLLPNREYLLSSLPPSTRSVSVIGIASPPRPSPSLTHLQRASGARMSLAQSPPVSSADAEPGTWLQSAWYLGEGRDIEVRVPLADTHPDGPPCYFVTWLNSQLFKAHGSLKTISSISLGEGDCCYSTR